MRKYRLTDETRTLADGTVVHRIAALRNGPWGPAGMRGGWIQSPDNLAQEDDCWVGGEAVVFQHAVVRDRAQVRNHAVVYGSAVVEGRAEVVDRAAINDRALVADTTLVMGEARVGSAAQVRGAAVVADRATVTDRAVVAGTAELHDAVYVGGAARVTGGRLEGAVVIERTAAITGPDDWIVIGPIHRWTLCAYRCTDGPWTVATWAAQMPWPTWTAWVERQEPGRVRDELRLATALLRRRIKGAAVAAQAEATP
jgi:carbonic anhydrase/acetyltransferase-like protein (isoleucine patch superfamily)